MSINLHPLIFIITLLSLIQGELLAGEVIIERKKYDVVVVGATASGVSAAVNAAREGMSVLLLQDDGHVGGLVSGGLSSPDFLSFESLGGTYLEFMQGVEQHYIDVYGPNAMQVVNCVKGTYPEPKVARLVLANMLSEAGVEVLLYHRLISTAMEKSSHSRKRIVGAHFLNIKTGEEISVEAAMFIDGTYEGDLLAQAGVPFRIGREGSMEYNEKLAPAEADAHVQAYNFRVVLTTNINNQIPIELPDGYDRELYTSLIPYIEENKVNTIDEISRYIVRIRRMPNDKAEFNDVKFAPVSLSRTGINNRWPEGDATVRKEIFKQYKDWSLGLLYFLQNDLEVPIAVRSELQKWALPADEYKDSDNWTPALYVREGRRMVGSYVFTEHDTRLEPNSVRSLQRDRAIAISDYMINTHKITSSENGQETGAIGRSLRPIQIPYDIMIPKETDGLLVPVAVSSSHIGFAALRYEPTWIALGQAAGIAAANAAKQNVAVRNIDIRQLQLRLHELGAMTIYVSDLGEPTDIPQPEWERPGPDAQVWLNKVPPVSPFFRPVQFFGSLGFFHNMIDPELATNWKRGRGIANKGLRHQYHAVEPGRPIDRDLAQDWLSRARELGIEPLITAEEVLNQELSRGELLIRLFKSMGTIN